MWRKMPGLLLGTAVLTSVWAVWVFAWPVLRFAKVAEHVGHSGILYLHSVGGRLLLGVGAAALYVGWTRHQFRWHRLIGYAYLIGGGVGATLGIVLALANTHTETLVPLAIDMTQVSELGSALATQGTVWLIVSAMAYRAARNRRFEMHRQWMIRSYVVAWGFVLGALVEQLPGASNIGDGAAVRWLSWVLPLVLCEVALQWRATARHVLQQPAHAGRGSPDGGPL
jgi:hypothetical protein